MSPRGATALTVSAIAPVLADDCQAVQSSLVAQVSTPYAETTTSGSHPDITVRDVTTSTRHYTKIDGAWASVPVTRAERLNGLADQVAHQKRACRRTGAESVFWISKATNLPLKHVPTWEQTSRRVDYTYDNVKPPAGAH